MAITPHENTGPDESLSSQLMAILNRQLSLARIGKLDEVLTLADKVDQLLSRADRKQLETIWTEGPVRDLHDELRLIFGAVKGEVAGELERVRKGKISLRAYKNISR